MADAATIRARLTCDEPAARRLAAFAAESLDPDNTVCAAFEGENGAWQVEIHFREPPDEGDVRKLIALGGGEAAASALTFDEIATEDWVAASLAGLKPVAAGRFVVHGAHDRARIAPNAIGIEIEAALAFGTGHHGTTRGCLLALDTIAKRRRQKKLIPPLKGEGRSERSSDRGGVMQRKNAPHPAHSVRHPPPCRGRDKKVLDLGTGSGVLAIAAARTFRTRVLATDIDPVAVVAARANAKLNRAGALVETVCAKGTNARRVGERAPFDLIFANILLGPLMRMAAPVARLAAPGAHIVLSGLLPAHANGVLAIYHAQGLALERRITLEGWVTLVMKRN